MNQDDNTQLILQLETAARLLGGRGQGCRHDGAHRHYDLIMSAARRIRELDTEICELHFLADGTADNEMLYEPLTEEETREDHQKEL